MTTNANRNTAIRTTKGNVMTVFTHTLPADIAANKKAAKKARRQARDEMRAHFDYDAIRANAMSPVAVDDAFDVYDANDGDPVAVYDAFVPAAS